MNCVKEAALFQPNYNSKNWVLVFERERFLFCVNKASFSITEIIY